MILLRNISKSYRSGVHALRGINLEIDGSEFVYIVGPAGCGRSTLVKLLDGEELPDAKEIYVAETNMGKLRYPRVPFYRHNIGVVFQDFRLLPKVTVFENIAFALEVLALDKATIWRQVREVLELVSFQDKARSSPDQLSGGRQYTTIARAVANHPKVLIANEPTGNLDPGRSMEIIELLDRINKVERTTIVMVAHDSILVSTYRKRTIALENGFIAADVTKGRYIHHD